MMLMLNQPQVVDAVAGASAREIDRIPNSADSGLRDAELTTIGGQEPIEDEVRRRPTFVVILMALSSVTGVGVASFGALAGGKLGLSFLRNFFQMVPPAFADLTLTIYDHVEAMMGRVNVRAIIAKREACWLFVAITQGTLQALWSISFDSARSGMVWQPVPMLYALLCYWLIQIYLFAGVMTQAHHDPQPNIWKWWILVSCAYSLKRIGECSSYSLVALVGTALYFLIVAFGLCFVIAHLDNNAVRQKAKHGYNL